MEMQDRDAVIAVALMAALADGHATEQEKAELRSAMSTAGTTDLETLTARITTGQVRLQDLAALPPLGIAERLGPEGLRLRELARGEAERKLLPLDLPVHFEDEIELEYPVELLEPLAFLLSRLINGLATRLATRGLATDELRLRLKLENRAAHERTLRLPHELVHLRVSGQMDDQVDLGPLDAVHPAPEGRVMAGEILQQRREGIVDPGIRALVDTKDRVAVPQEAKRQIGADLARGAGDENAHQARD